jgi:hypothetical protein
MTTFKHGDIVRITNDIRWLSGHTAIIQYPEQRHGQPGYIVHLADLPDDAQFGSWLPAGDLTPVVTPELPVVKPPRIRDWQHLIVVLLLYVAVIFAGLVIAGMAMGVKGQ